MKKKKLKLSLSKMTVAKINNSYSIKGGGETNGCITYVGDNTCPHTNCNWQCNPQESKDVCEATDFRICTVPLTDGC